MEDVIHRVMDSSLELKCVSRALQGQVVHTHKAVLSRLPRSLLVLNECRGHTDQTRHYFHPTVRSLPSEHVPGTSLFGAVPILPCL